MQEFFEGGGGGWGGALTHTSPNFQGGAAVRVSVEAIPQQPPLYLAASQRRNLATPEELFSKSCMQYGYVDTRQLGKLQSNLRPG